MEPKVEVEMRVSITRAVDQSIRWVQTSLFRHFSFEKWFVLGFCTFLASLGRGGVGVWVWFNKTGNVFGKPSYDGQSFQHMEQWVMVHLAPIILIGGGLILVALAFGVLLQWLSSRGKFIFLDGVVRDRAAVVEPWKKLKELANSLFFFRFFLAVVTFVVLTGIIILGLVEAISATKYHSFGPGSIIALVSGGCFFFLFAIAVAIISLVLKDFVVPIMYLRNIKTMPAFGVFKREVLRGRLGTIILYYLLKFVLAIAAGIVIFFGTCLTCCIAGLPYLSSVVFLPVFVFFRSYPLFLLEQLGPDWRFFPEGHSLAPRSPLIEETGFDGTKGEESKL